MLEEYVRTAVGFVFARVIQGPTTKCRDILDEPNWRVDSTATSHSLSSRAIAWRQTRKPGVGSVASPNCCK